MLAGTRTRLTIPNPGDSQAFRVGICRLPAGVGGAAGSYDNVVGSPYRYTYLHLEVVMPASGLSISPNEDRVPFVSEWDPEGVEILPPGCSEVWLVGGSGLYSVTFEPVFMPPPPQRPHGALALRFRRLMRFVPRNGTAPFFVPAGHNTIGSLNGWDGANVATLVNLSDAGVPLRLNDGVQQPIPSGTQIATRVGGPDVMAWTGFWA
jgi:hypothetical protein